MQNCFINKFIAQKLLLIICRFLNIRWKEKILWNRILIPRNKASSRIGNNVCANHRAKKRQRNPISVNSARCLLTLPMIRSCSRNIRSICLRLKMDKASPGPKHQMILAGDCAETERERHLNYLNFPSASLIFGLQSSIRISIIDILVPYHVAA